jgi:hypothetical protein
MNEDNAMNGQPEPDAQGDTNGAGAPGAGIAPAKGVLVIILGAFVGLVLIRQGFKPQKAL